MQEVVIFQSHQPDGLLIQPRLEKGDVVVGYKI